MNKKTRMSLEKQINSGLSRCLSRRRFVSRCQIFVSNFFLFLFLLIWTLRKRKTNLISQMCFLSSESGQLSIWYSNLRERKLGVLCFLCGEREILFMLNYSGKYELSVFVFAEPRFHFIFELP